MRQRIDTNRRYHGYLCGPGASECLSGLKFVVTGVLDSITRDDVRFATRTAAMICQDTSQHTTTPALGAPGTMMRSSSPHTPLAVFHFGLSLQHTTTPALGVPGTMVRSSSPHTPLSVFHFGLSLQVVVSNCCPVYCHACPILGRGSHKAVRRCKPKQRHRHNGLLPDGA